MARGSSREVARVVERLQAKYPSMNRETLTGIARNVQSTMRGEKVDANKPNTQVKRGTRQERARRKKKR